MCFGVKVNLFIRDRGGSSALRARICKPRKPRNRFTAWQACTTTLFVVSARQATQGGGIDSSESIPGLHKRLQIRALNTIRTMV
jgi:hypothetical protein